MKKRFLAILLAICMAASLLPTIALAAEDPQPEGLPFGMPEITVNLNNTDGTVVGFDTQEWYVIGDDTTGINPVEDNLTLLHRLDYSTETDPTSQKTEEDWEKWNKWAEENIRYGQTTFRNCRFFEPTTTEDNISTYPLLQKDGEQWYALYVRDDTRGIHVVRPTLSAICQDVALYFAVDTDVTVDETDISNVTVYIDRDNDGEMDDNGYLVAPLNPRNDPDKYGWSKPSDYSGSTLATHLNWIATELINDREVALITPRTLTADDGIYGKDAVDQKLWHLSKDEAEQSTAVSSNYFYNYVLRSASSEYMIWFYRLARGTTFLWSTYSLYWGTLDEFVNENDQITMPVDPANTTMVRPALNLNIEDVLFTTAASGENGKKTDVVTLDKLQSAASLWAEDDPIKFTMKDPVVQTLTVANEDRTVSVANGQGTLRYSGAATGENQHVSCVITEKGPLSDAKILYYGKLADCTDSSSGEITLTVPENLRNGTHQMYVFSEQDNGNNLTDFAGDLIPITFSQKCTVTFDPNGGQLAEGTDASVAVEPGQMVSRPGDPVRAGYQFEGWYTEAAGGVAYDFGTPVSGDVTLYAHWTKKPDRPTYYTLHYESNGGTEYKDERYKRNTVVELDKVPVREGYRFTGWYADAALTEPVDSVKMTRDRTVYAGWQKSTVPELLNGEDHFAYVVGYEDGTVRPQANISRAEVAAIFFRLLKADIRDGNLTTESGFADVTEAMWSNQAIATMAKLGILQGRTAETFVPNAPITRAEFAAICARFDTGLSQGASSFTDIDGHWAKEEIQKAVSLGWILGYEDNTFRPDANITRAEAVTMINRVLCRIPETEEDLLADMRTWPDNQPGLWYYLAVQEATNSHEYTAKGEIYETWTNLTQDPDWSQYQ